MCDSLVKVLIVSLPSVLSGMLFIGLRAIMGGIVQSVDFWVLTPCVLSYLCLGFEGTESQSSLRFVLSFLIHLSRGVAV